MSAWESLRERIQEIESLEQISGLLEWDQQTYMPSGGASSRGKQTALMSALVHQRLVSADIGDWLGTLEEQQEALSDVQRAAVRNIRRRHRQEARLPEALVRAYAEATSAGLAAWIAAKEADDFSLFAPALETIVSLTREKAAHLGDAAHPYDNLLEIFDAGSRVSELTPMFARLSDALRPLVDDAIAQPQPARLSVKLPLDALRRVNERVVSALGFRTSEGRLDEAEHPFTLGVTRHDVRLTTHYRADDLLGTLFGTIHETGHGLYEQGLPHRPGTFTDKAVSMGMHESQSRFWENTIGRSRPFLTWLVGLLREEAPQIAWSVDELFGAANRVERSLIRIHADEMTYNLHILARYELERALIAGDLEVGDLPNAWADTVERVVGARPPNDRDGVLQDVHWSAGLFGYFPSYTLGNLYAASFRFAMEGDLPEMWSSVERGDFSPILTWLRTNIHDVGSMTDAPELFTQVVGDRDPVADLVQHLRDRRRQLAGG